MDKDNFPSCEFPARAKDYHGWSNAEQPLVQGLARAGQPLIWATGRGGSSNEGEAASHLPEFNYCPCLPRPRPLTHQIFIFFISMEGVHMWGLPYCEGY